MENLCYTKIYQTLSDELSWSHYIELSKIKDETMRKFLYRLSIL